jgi:hypothetical protein
MLSSSIHSSAFTAGETTTQDKYIDDVRKTGLNVHAINSELSKLQLAGWTQRRAMPLILSAVCVFDGLYE